MYSNVTATASSTPSSSASVSAAGGSSSGLPNDLIAYFCVRFGVLFFLLLAIIMAVSRRGTLPEWLRRLRPGNRFSDARRRYSVSTISSAAVTEDEDVADPDGYVPPSDEVSGDVAGSDGEINEVQSSPVVTQIAVPPATAGTSADELPPASVVASGVT